MGCNQCKDEIKLPKNDKGCATPGVIQIENAGEIITFHTVQISAAQGDEEDIPPVNGLYKNTLLVYEVNGHVYLYNSDGIPVFLNKSTGAFDSLSGRPRYKGVEMTSMTDIPDVTASVAAEAELREAADSAEAAARENADAALDEKIDNEISDRQDAISALADDLAAEEIARAEADDTLQDNIDAEEAARIAADDGLQGDIAAEEAARREGDTDLQDALDAETSARLNSEAILQGNIDAEIATRVNSDNSLQAQIDAISASSDVRDIVGTYAALQLYDTSTLGNNDIIKVLQDETHSGETTYYRWSTTTETFTLIGEEGPYYTKSAADQKFQLILTAGSNISIGADNTISASYPNFIGTDGTSNGVAGLVPAPASTDVGKVLGASGSWVTGGPTVVQTRGTSTTDVMSQDAVTNLIYTDDTYYKQIAIGTGAQTGDASSGYAYSVAIGTSALAGIAGGVSDSGAEATAIGSGAVARGKYGTAIGRYAKAGQNGVAQANGCVSIGSYANSYGTAIAVGGGTASNTSSTPDIAKASYAQGDGAIAIGVGAVVNTVSGKKGSIALGAGATVLNQTGVMNIGTYDTSYGYSNSGYRLLTGVYDPQNAHDAATKGYVDSVAGSVFTNNEWNALWA